MIWIGFDVGGTFTDLLSMDLESGKVTATKTPSSAREPAAAALRGIELLLELGGHRGSQVERIVHGTTIATNALIELEGARVGFICNEGFRDVVEIGRMLRDELFNIDFTKTPSLVPRDLREEVRVRRSVTGEVVIPLDEADVRGAVRRLLDRGVDAIAVGLLHSYLVTSDEERIREIALEESPDLVVSLSHEVSREYGEHERWTTTIVNAFLMPKIRSYLHELELNLRTKGIRAPLEIMQSNGGLASVEVASRLPICLLESGPAGGTAGVARLAGQLGLDKLITLDIGGTSTDVSVVLDHKPTIITERTVAGYPVRAIMADIHSVGAGGGSIARVDASRTLHVGPHSAGADPGPVAVGKGGTEPTVTDADVVLGYLNPERYCAGQGGLALQLNAAIESVARVVAEPTGTTINQAAMGILGVTVRNMVGAIRTITTQRGLDPREFTLVAFGGAGPVHAGMVAQALQIPRVLIPAYPALLSARGMLLADHRADVSLSHPALLSDVDGERLTSLFKELEVSASEFLPGDTGQLTVDRIAEVCYDGQRQSISLSLPSGQLTDEGVAGVGRRLDGWFLAQYGFVPVSHIPRLVNLRVMLGKTSVTTERIRNTVMREESRVATPALSSRRMVFEEHPEGIDSPVHDRAQMGARQVVLGPCVIEEDYSTTVVFPGQCGYVDEAGNLFIDTGVKA